MTLRMEGEQMLQDIAPNIININYKNRTIAAKDIVIFIEDGELFIVKDEDSNAQAIFPTFELANSLVDRLSTDVMYLFAIDTQHYYLYIGDSIKMIQPHYQAISRRDLYEGFDNVYGFIAYTACHVYDWLKNNKYCGKCGQLTTHRVNERAIECQSCGVVRYPQINPVVIVCIHDNDKILLTKYANSSYDRYALVAGFVEIGESFEEAVHREVMEEVGVKVKNLTYYASQPWGISGGLMAGYFAELDGDNTIKLDTEELKEGTWLTKDEMPIVNENEKSLTRTLMYEWYRKQ